ncbi:MAG: hypothetical protein NT075_01880 [Chloroflexi bacterium]|nr:hypothetical protein [Chloroflexota bacterium]
MTTGLSVQLLSRRVLWIRYYQASAFLLLSALYATLLWMLLAAHRNGPEQVFTALIILLLMVSSGIAVFLRNSKRIAVTRMPYGPNGLLNPKTGIVDPLHSPVLVQEQWNKTAKQSRAWERWKPLVAGLSMFLVKVLPRSEVNLILVVIGLLWMILCASATGGAAAYIAEIMHWEREHQKHIYVKFQKSDIKFIQEES